MPAFKAIPVTLILFLIRKGGGGGGGHPRGSNDESQRITEGTNKRIPGTQMVLHRRAVRGTALGGIVEV